MSRPRVVRRKLIHLLTYYQECTRRQRGSGREVVSVKHCRVLQRKCGQGREVPPDPESPPIRVDVRLTGNRGRPCRGALSHSTVSVRTPGSDPDVPAPALSDRLRPESVPATRKARAPPRSSPRRPRTPPLGLPSGNKTRSPSVRSPSDSYKTPRHQYVRPGGRVLSRGHCLG